MDNKENHGTQTGILPEGDKNVQNAFVCLQMKYVLNQERICTELQGSNLFPAEDS